MREIKFRAWDKAHKFMAYNKKAAISFNGRLKTNAGFRDIEETDYELMQYTGLKDKNGAEIYEGDILSHETNYEPYKCVMEWHDNLGSCGCCYDDCKSVGFVGRVLPNTEYKYSSLASGYSEMIIIGNKYENPDLMKDETNLQK